MGTKTFPTPQALKFLPISGKGERLGKLTPQGPLPGPAWARLFKEWILRRYPAYIIRVVDKTNYHPLRYPLKKYT